jgi:hypothetical protein
LRGRHDHGGWTSQCDDRQHDDAEDKGTQQSSDDRELISLEDDSRACR